VVSDAAIPWEGDEAKWTVDLLAERTLLPRDRIVNAVVRGELPVAVEGDEPRFFMRDVFMWVSEHKDEPWVDTWLKRRDDREWEEMTKTREGVQ
jgi:hypothetical protein